MQLLIGRNKLGVKRDPMQSKAKIGQSAFFSLIVAAVFSGIGFHNEDGLVGKIDADILANPNSPKYRMKLFGSVMEVYGAIYFVSINQFMGNFMNVILVFQGERPVFLRE